jgi:hypothetical protein
MNTSIWITHHFQPLKSLKALGNKIWEIEHIVTRHNEMLEARYKQITYQLIMLGSLAVMFVGVTTFNYFTNFFPYPYLKGGFPNLEILLSFWPLGLWCLFLLIVGNNQVRSSHLDGKLWRTGMITGNLAGIWEEIGYRYLYIMPAMGAVMFTNWLLGTWFTWVFLGLWAIGTLAIFADDKHKTVSGVKSLLMLILMIYIWGEPDPWYWAYENVIMPAINWVSLDSFRPIFMNPEQHMPLMVMGAILANHWFRDGHKYQGVAGWLDSWVVGFVFMYACFTHGLLTAMALHCIWNSLVYTSILLKRKAFG